MLYWLYEQAVAAGGHHPLLNLMKYLTFRTGMALFTAQLVVVLMGSRFIRWMQARQGKGQPIRTDGIERHVIEKSGTPTMGGVMILAGLFTGALLWCDLSNVYVWAVLLVTAGFGVLGFLDDYAKVTRQSSAGVSGRLRLVVEALLAGSAVLMMVLWGRSSAGESGLYTSVAVPILKDFLTLTSWPPSRGSTWRRCSAPPRRPWSRGRGRRAPSPWPRSRACGSSRGGPRAASAPAPGASCPRWARTCAIRICPCGTLSRSRPGMPPVVESGAEPAKGLTPAGRLALGLAVAVLVVDQAVKAWILDGLNLPARISVPVFGPLRLSMVWNEGVSFGFLQARHDLARWGLTVFAMAVALGLAAWARRAERRLLGVALGLIIGGAIGNAIDRARFGAVVDFVDVSALGFFPWVFNIADSAITIGVILMLLDSFRRETPTAP